jgi:hypothetical protein
MVFRKLEVEFGSALGKVSKLPYPTRFFIVQALQFFAGTPPDLRERYYRVEHGAFEIGVGDVGRLLVDVDEAESVVEVLDFVLF